MGYYGLDLAGVDMSAGDVDWVMNELRLKLEVGHLRG